MSEDEKVTLTDGGPVTDDHKEIIKGGPRDGQQKGYIVLSAEERAKGFVRPVRRQYLHQGRKPKYALLDLTPEQKERYAVYGYVKYEQYPESESPMAGHYWTQADLDRISAGCMTTTWISDSIAETYARNPHFYGGTFCAGCRSHFPLEEFVWCEDGEKVGS